MSSAKIAATSARKPQPLSAKHQAGPNQPITAPPTSGPTTRAALNEIELSEIAFNRCSGGTSRGTTAWNTGLKRALALPVASEIAITIQTVTCPLAVSAASAKAAVEKTRAAPPRIRR